MSSRVEVLGLLVNDLKHILLVEYAFNIINLSFMGTYESLDDFLWDTSIEATNLLLPNLDLGPNTQLSEHTLESLRQVIFSKIIYKTNQALGELALNYGR